MIYWMGSGMIVKDFTFLSYVGYFVCIDDLGNKTIQCLLQIY